MHKGRFEVVAVHSQEMDATNVPEIDCQKGQDDLASIAHLTYAKAFGNGVDGWNSSAMGNNGSHPFQCRSCFQPRIPHALSKRGRQSEVLQVAEGGLVDKQMHVCAQLRLRMQCRVTGGMRRMVKVEL